MKLTDPTFLYKIYGEPCIGKLDDVAGAVDLGAIHSVDVTAITEVVSILGHGFRLQALEPFAIRRTTSDDGYATTTYRLRHAGEALRLTNHEFTIRTDLRS